MPLQLGLPVINPFSDGFIEREAQFRNGMRLERRRRWDL
jgi:hypothetical protein